MSRRVLDTNILVSYWGYRRQGRRYEDIQTSDARSWAQALIKFYRGDAIVTPIYIEYLAGQPTARAVGLAEAYLGEFEVIDQGSILDEDWEDAIRIARRIPPLGNLRQMGDCLIRAICNRLNHEVISTDSGFPT